MSSKRNNGGSDKFLSSFELCYHDRGAENNEEPIEKNFEINVFIRVVLLNEGPIACSGGHTN